MLFASIPLFDWILLMLCGLLIGFAKTGVSSLGILTVTILTFIFPAKASVGILLPLLLVGDVFAVTYYRRSVVWKYLLSLLPWVLIGLVAGYLLLNVINSKELAPLIGSLVLLLIILHIVMDRYGDKVKNVLPHSKVFTFFVGILAGFTTMIGNAAGGIMSIYLLVKRLPKERFVGTGAWFFLTVNLIKVPLYIKLHLITLKSFEFDIRIIPIIIIGALIGIKVLPHIPQKVFTALVLIFSTVGALKLLI